MTDAHARVRRRKLFGLSTPTRWLAAAALLALVMTACGDTAPSDPSLLTWSGVDVGSVGAVGHSTVEDGGRTVVARGSGEDVYGTSDSFHFVYTNLDGDGSITVRVRGIEELAAWTKAGVMIRESTSPDAANVFALLTPNNGSVMQSRVEAGAVTTEPGWDRAPRAPFWLRLERNGDRFTASQSSDGAEWAELGSTTLSMPSTALIGLAITSTVPGELAEAVFDQTSVILQSPVPGPDPEPEPDPDPDPVPGPGPVPPPLPGPIVGPTVSASYQVDMSSFLNPERGWYVERDSGSYDSVRSGGNTLVMRYVRLDDFRTQPLPAWLLDGLRADFAAARAAGVKVLPRFAYNRGEAPDAPLSWVIQHIAQLAPVLRDNSDVIAALQAGFIGYWAEWHGSTNDLLSFDNRRQIVNALLGAVDTSRMIQIRYPYRASDLYPTPPTAATAFDGGDASRVAQLNDCFLSNASDGGTFTSDADRRYVELVTPFTVMGGETCTIGGLSARNDCSTALDELDRYNYDYLNRDYYRGVIDKWQSQGCYGEVDRRLGYRFAMQSAISAAGVAPGGTLQMVVRMENQGFGKVYNPRPLEVVLVPRDGGAPLTLRAYEDARTVLPLSGEVRDVALALRLPDNAPLGTYDAYLRLPDASARLAADARYAIRLANVDTWNATTGLNALRLPIEVAD